MRKIIIALSAVLFVCITAIFLYIDVMQHPSAPVPLTVSGYYDDEFTLCFKSLWKGLHIYYTLDGSTPDQNSNVYQDGIVITDKKMEPNVYNSIVNVLPDYDTHVTDTTPVEKGTIVRAVTISDWGYSSDIVTQTYFVGMEQTADTYAISLVFDSDNLFGDDGIYVTGKDYDDWYLNTDRTEEAPAPNFEKHLETTCIVEMLQNGKDILNQPAGIRLQGASHRRFFSKKRFILVSREELSGSKYFACELYDGILTHSVMLKDYLTDAIAAELMEGRALATQQARSAKVYLNGEYWNDTYMLERYDKKYFKEHYDVDHPIIIKNAEDIDGDENHNAIYKEFLLWVENTDLSQQQNWEELKKKIDIQSYIDYITLNYYLCNCDFTEKKNYVLWRSEESEGNGYNDGRWRWCVFDVDAIDFASGYFDVENLAEINIFSCKPPFTSPQVNQNPLFQAFCQNAEFRKQFVLSFLDLFNNNFNTERVAGILKKYGYDLTWQDGYFEKRPFYAKLHLADEFNLTGNVETVTIKTDNPAAGKIIVNTSELDLSDGKWTGEYFTDYPITVTAIPNKGYKFVGWEGGITSSDGTMEIAIDGGIELRACFEK